MNITYAEIGTKLDAYAAEFDMKFNKNQRHLMISFTEWLLSQKLKQCNVSGALPTDKVALHAANTWFQSAKIRSDISASFYSYYEGFRDALKFSEDGRQ